MATHLHPVEHGTPALTEVHGLARYLAPLGRAMFAAIFLLALPGHFSPGTIQYAASAGVPQAQVLVPLSGILAFLGGLSVLLGYRTRAGALFLLGFLFPVTLAMHPFWTVPDPMIAGMQKAMFLKNLGMMGGALLLLYHGAGPVSFDEQKTAE